jgi:hypothetical protein
MAVLGPDGNSVTRQRRILGCRLRTATVLGSALGIALWVAASSATGLFAQSREASEYQVKAAFLYNFAKFVEWPGDVFKDPSDPITICVVGEDLFGAILATSVRGKTINGHNIVIRLLKPRQSLRGCQIGFISSSARKDLGSILLDLEGASVLTVGETKGFAAMGGIINFVIEQDRFRFEVNVDAAERAGLKISSKLLSLAKIVREENHGKKT